MYKTNLKKYLVSFLLGIMVFASLAISPPVSKAKPLFTPPIEVVVNKEATEVTVSFNVYAVQVNTLEDLKTAITVKRSDAEDYVALDAEDTITFENIAETAELVVTFAEALAGNTNTLKIASGALMNDIGMHYNMITTDIIDVAAPSYAGSETDYNGAEVDLYFDENININTSEVDKAQFLRNQISVATDGVNFTPLLENSYIGYGYNYIYIEYDDDVQIILGSNTRIKIAAGTIIDDAGNVNEEMILQVTPPVIQSVDISEEYHDVTITYDVNVYDNTSGSLEDEIYLVKGNDRISLGQDDSVEIIDGKLVIHFAKALFGSDNQINIDGGSIKDVFGNIAGDDRLTGFIQGSETEVEPPMGDDTIAPQFIRSYYSNSFNTVNFVFNEDIQMADESAFRTAIQWYDSDRWSHVNGLPPEPDAVVTISGPILSIEFAAYPGNTRYVSLQQNAVNQISDLAGNQYLTGSIYTHRIYSNTMDSPTFDMRNSHFSFDGRRLNLEFSLSDYNYLLVEKTTVDGGTLKEGITYSLDQGSTFTALSSDDIVTIQRNKIIIIFHEAIKEGSVRIRINENLLSDQYDYQSNSAIDQVIHYNTPTITGFMFSDVDSEFVFQDNELWRNSIREIYIEDDDIGVNRQLNSSEYSITEGKLILNKGLFQEGQYYYITINAEGHSSKYIEGIAFKSAEIFYVTAPTLTTDNGITASINLFNNIDPEYYYYLSQSIGTQTVIFQLMNGTTPVSIVAAKLQLNTGTYTANFNVSDAATNSNYTVRAFVVSSYDNDLGDVGINLATVKTQSEIDILIMSAPNGQNGPNY